MSHYTIAYTTRCSSCIIAAAVYSQRCPSASHQHAPKSPSSVDILLLSYSPRAPRLYSCLRPCGSSSPFATIDALAAVESLDMIRLTFSNVVIFLPLSSAADIASRDWRGLRLGGGLVLGLDGPALVDVDAVGFPVLIGSGASTAFASSAKLACDSFFR